MSTNSDLTVEMTDREKELRERIEALVREARKDKGELSLQEVADSFDNLNMTEREFDHALDILSEQGIEILLPSEEDEEMLLEEEEEPATEEEKPNTNTNNDDDLFNDSPAQQNSNYMEFDDDFFH